MSTRCLSSGLLLEVLLLLRGCGLNGQGFRKNCFDHCSNERHGINFIAVMACNRSCSSCSLLFRAKWYYLDNAKESSKKKAHEAAALAELMSALAKPI